MARMSFNDYLNSSDDEKKQTQPKRETFQDFLNAGYKENREQFSPTRQDVFNSAGSSTPSIKMNPITVNNTIQNRIQPPPAPTRSLQEDVQPFKVQEPELKKTYTDVRTPALKRDSWVREQMRDDARAAAANPVTQTIDNALRPLTYAINSATSYLAPFQKGAGNALGVRADTAPYEPTLLNKTLEVGGNIAGSLTNPTMISQGIANLGLRTGSALAQKAAQALPKLGNRITQRAITGATAGAAQGAIISGVRGETDLDELAVNVGLGAALGGAGDAAIGAIGQGIRALRNARTAPASTNLLPQPKVDVPQTPIQQPIAQSQQLLPQSVQRVNTSSVKVSPERGFNSTLRQSDNITDEVRQGLEQSPNRTYEPITNEQTVATANQRISQGIDTAESQLLNKAKYNAEDVATGMRLIQELQSSGNVQRAVTIADRLASELTKAGQTVQAASIWNRLSPEGALLAAQQKVRRINETLYRGQETVKITDKQATAITEAAQTMQSSGISQERAGIVSDIMNRAKNGESISVDDRKIISDFVADANKFLKPTKINSPKQASVPKEMNDTRVRDRVVSFLEEQEQAALERIKSRRGRMNSLPLDEWADYAIVGASKMAKGTVKFADWSEQMVRDLGESIRPHLVDIYERSKQTQIDNVKKINDQVISRAERIATNYVTKNADKLSQSDIDFVQNLARKVSSLSDQDRRIASQDLQAILNGFEKVGVGRKLQSAQYISMLLNPLTQIRNIVGNEMLYRLERLQRIAATPIDIAYSKMTGKDRTITFKRGPSVWENYFQPSKDYLSSLGEGLSAGWRGVSPEGLTTKYEIQGQAFRSKYNPMTYFEKSLGAVLQGFDYAAYQRSVNQRMSEIAYLDALNKGIKGDDAIRNHMNVVMTNIDEATHNLARDYGKFVTLQNDSPLARKIMGFRRGLNKITTGSDDFGAGSIAVPFAKTPANLLMRGIDYSPAGFLKSIGQGIEVFRNPNTDLTRADVIESASRALFGTGIGGLAIWLTDKGALFGKSDKDAEVRKLMQGAGIKDFQVNGSAMQRMIEALITGGDVDQAAKLQPGDTLWGYEWAQPVSMPAAVGSTVYQGIKDSKGVGKIAVDSTVAAVNTLLDSSVMSGIREMFNIQMGSESPFTDILLNLVKQLPSQFVPSIMRQINTLSDDSVKETYAPKDDVLGQFTNSAQSNIPGLSQQMPQRVNTLGEPQTKLNTFVDVFLSPAQRSVYNPSPESQLVIDLINETGDNSIAPRAVQKYLSGNDVKTGEKKRIDLTPEQYVELQTIVGQETAEGLKKVNPNWSSEKKISFILKVLDDAGKKGRNKLKKDLGLKVTK